MTTLTISGDCLQINDAARSADPKTWPSWVQPYLALDHTQFGALHQMGSAPAWFLMTSGGRVIVADGDWIVRDSGGELHRFSAAAYARMTGAA